MKVLKINMKQTEIFQNVSDAPQKTTKPQLHPSIFPFKRPNTFLIGKKKNISYSFLVHNIPIFSKKCSRVRIALQS